jgi:hypothetical protein
MNTPPNKIPFHPSYGYATPDQVQKLMELKDGTEYKQLLKQIEIQTKNKGVME